MIICDYFDEESLDLILQLVGSTGDDEAVGLEDRFRGGGCKVELEV